LATAQQAASAIAALHHSAVFGKKKFHANNALMLPPLQRGAANHPSAFSSDRPSPPLFFLLP
jgi:hypothetical protein